MSVFSGNSEKESGSLKAHKGSWKSLRAMPFFNRYPKGVLWVFPLLLVLGFLFLITSGYQGLKQLNQLAQKREALIHSNQEMNRTNKTMYREITRLRTDPVYLEECARKEFGLVKADEIIFFLEEAEPKEKVR